MHAGVPESSLAVRHQQYVPPSGTATAPGMEWSALFSTTLPRKDGTWQSGVHTASLLPGKGEKSRLSLSALVPKAQAARPF